MEPPPTIHAQTLDDLARVRSFLVHPCPGFPEPADDVPAKEKVIRPLLRAAIEAFVWPPMYKTQGEPYPADVLAREHGRYRFDLSRELLTGHERFWYAPGGRGSIVLRVPDLPDTIVEILMHCSLGGAWGSRYQLAKGNSAGAVRYCYQVIDAGEFAFLFSASNSIQCLSIFAPSEEIERVYRLAAEWCRPFKRWFECVPGEAVNLIEQRSA
jgi:hypothetical protein